LSVKGRPKNLKADPGALWVSLRVLGSAMEHLDQPQGSWIRHGTLRLASRYLDHLWNTCVSLKVLGSSLKLSSKHEGTCVSSGTLRSVMGDPRNFLEADLSVPWLI
jgi:hypothetical protein